MAQVATKTQPCFDTNHDPIEDFSTTTSKNGWYIAHNCSVTSTANSRQNANKKLGTTVALTSKENISTSTQATTTPTTTTTRREALLEGKDRTIQTTQTRSQHHQPRQ